MFTELNRSPLKTKVSFIPRAIDPAKQNPVHEITYEEWRRYKNERRNDEGIRLTMALKRSGIFGTEVLKRLAEIDANARFKQYGWTEPIQIDPTNPILVVNFRENEIKEDPTYLDDFFKTVEDLLNDTQRFSTEFIDQIKKAIAHTCFERFKTTIEDLGFNRGFKEATALLLPTALHGIDSPYILAAKYCSEQERIAEARTLLTLVSPKHWQYAEAMERKSELYELELHELRAEIRHLRLKILNFGATENVPQKENVKETVNIQHARPAILTGFKQSLQKSQAKRFSDATKLYFDPDSKWRM